MPLTTELLISEITLMGPGFCVIGLERGNSGFRSLRPIPRSSFSWPTFGYSRGDRVSFELARIPARLPHAEDRQARHHHRLGSLNEQELVQRLKQAEVASSIKDLFGCDVHPSPRGGDAVYASANEAKRSICGCAITAVTFSFRFFPKIRVCLALPSGEVLQSVPLVDSQWTKFAAEIAGDARTGQMNQSRARYFFERFVQGEITASALRFARIGLSRPDKDGFCWLMLDSLFPLPKKDWLSRYDV